MTSNKNELVITSTNEKVDEESHSRETWSNQCEFFLSCLGFAVGFGNVWRFPYLCYKNGGAVFLIPYVIMLLIAGLPMFFLELALGQYVSLGPNILFPELSPIFSGIGWAMLATTGMTTLYYNMVFAWSLFYTFASFQSVLPWSNCDNSFNSINCFTYDQAISCKNQSLYFYNDTCLMISEFCDISEYKVFNDTHCYNGSVQNIKSAEESVARISASEDYYKNRMLGVTGYTWENMGGLRWELVACLALAWIIVCACMIKGVKSSGKVVYVTAIFPYIVLFILFIRGITLDGAYDGIKFYILEAKIEKLYEIQVWNDAATQIFYSLSAAFGGLITLSSYNKFRNNCMRDAITIAFANCATSIFAGFVIFSILGFMAKEIGVNVGEVIDSGSGLAFIAYPAAVSRMPLPPLWSILFFTMLITLGLDSQFTYVETLSTGIFDYFESTRTKKPQVMICISIVMFLLGLTLCLNGGVFMFELLNYYSGGLSVLFIAFCEVMVVSYVYGFKRFMKNITEDMGIYMPYPLYLYWSVTWLFLTPLSLVIILCFSIYFFQKAQWGTYLYPDNIQTLGLLTTFASMICIPIFAIWVVLRSKKIGKDLFRPTNKFCPAHVREQKDGKKKAEESFKYIYDNEGYVHKDQRVPTSSINRVTPTDADEPKYTHHM